jgi:uncharacterized membrane protein YfhO
MPDTATFIVIILFLVLFFVAFFLVAYWYVFKQRPEDRHRYILSLSTDAEFKDALERLTEELNLSDAAKTVRLALAMLLAAVKAKKDGYRIIVLDSDDTVLREFVLPEIEENK